MQADNDDGLFQQYGGKMSGIWQTITQNDTDSKLIRAILQIKDHFPRDADVAAGLAQLIAASGAQIPAKGPFSADLASTGGPSSLSTLACPLFLRIAGAVVPKLGVPGRPAGGIDCLAQIPNYRYALTEIDVEKGLETSGYVHFIGEGIAPLDLRLFRLRQQHSAQDVPTLVAASLMAKKLAVGVKQAGLDIRVAPHGNFGRTWESATQNARLFIDVGHQLGISAAPVLTDGRFPYQPYIGRKEALLALYRLFDAQLSPWLNEHFDACRTMALSCTPHHRRSQVQHASSTDLRDAFERNINFQGGRVDSIRELLNRTEAAHHFAISATQDGFVSFNLGGIRRILVERQRTRVTATNEFPDPVGVILTKRPGEWVQRGDCLATLRVDDTTDLDVLSELAGSSIAVQPQPASTGLEGVPA